jgi:hypothetical protein
MMYTLWQKAKTAVAVAVHFMTIVPEGPLTASAAHFGVMFAVLALIFLYRARPVGRYNQGKQHPQVFNWQLPPSARTQDDDGASAKQRVTFGTSGRHTAELAGRMRSFVAAFPGGFSQMLTARAAATA